MEVVITCKNTVYRLDCISIQSSYLHEKMEYCVCLETLSGFYYFTTKKDTSYHIKYAHNHSLYFEADNIEIVYKTVPKIETRTVETAEEFVKILANRSNNLQTTDNNIIKTVLKEDKQEETC